MAKQSHRRRQMMGETRLLMEYLLLTYPSWPWFTNMKLGTDIPAKSGVVLDEAERRLLRVYKRYADAVVITDSEIIVIEATISRSTDKVGPLLQYVSLVPHTPELRPFLGRMVVGVILSAVPDAVAENLARKVGVRYVTFTPPWLEEFFAIYPGRIRRAPAPGTIEL